MATIKIISEKPKGYSKHTGPKDHKLVEVEISDYLGTGKPFKGVWLLSPKDLQKLKNQ